MTDYQSFTVVLASGAFTHFGACKVSLREDHGFLIVVCDGEHHIYPRDRWVEAHGTV